MPMQIKSIDMVYWPEEKPDSQTNLGPKELISKKACTKTDCADVLRPCDEIFWKVMETSEEPGL